MVVPFDNTSVDEEEQRRTGQQESVHSTRACLLVLGMHRSGTSAVTRTLNLLGSCLPKTVSGFGRGNEGGHWEPAPLVLLHDSMLAEAGSRWDDWRVFDPELIGFKRARYFKSEIKRHIVEEYGEAPLIVLKDPRICRFAGFYQEMLGELDVEPLFVLTHRNPLAVIASLQERDNMTRGFASLLWLRHVLDAEFATRGRPRAFVSYEEFLDGWRKQARQIAQALSLSWPRPQEEAAAEIENHLSYDLQHHDAAMSTLEADPEVVGWIKTAYRALCGLSQQANSEAALAALDRVRVEFEAAALVFGEATFPELNARERRLTNARDRFAGEAQQAVADVQRLNSESQSDKSWLETILAESSQKDQRIDALSTELDQIGEQLKQKALQSESDRMVITEITSQSSQKDKQIKALARDLTQISEDSGNIVGRLESLSVENKNLHIAYQEVFKNFNREKLTVLRPLYRNFFRASSIAVRSILPDHAVNRIRSYIPNPEGIPKRLPHQPPVYNPTEQATANVEPSGAQPDIFLFSIIPWDFRQQRPQHIAKFLSAKRRVFYFEMELSSGGLSVAKVAENLYRVRLPRATIGLILPYSGQPSSDQIRSWLSAFYSFIDQVNATAFKQVLIQHPFWWQFLQHLSPEFQIVVDCMDDISGFDLTVPHNLTSEQNMLQKCDKLVVSSQYLYNKYQAYDLPALIRNGCEIEHFTETGSVDGIPNFLLASGFSKRPGKIYIGYVGAIAEWFDAELLANVARGEQDFEFHLCGGVTSADAAKLDELDNVTMYGEIPYDDVPGFLEQMDVLTIPFKLIPLIHACDPVKFYEYSAMGKPTVTTPLPELARVEQLVFFAETAKEFARQVRRAHEKCGDSAFRAALRDYAADHTWQKRGAKFEEVLTNFPLVSVIILSCGMPIWVKAALQSLYAGSAHYPNLEVVVVDNGSPPAALAELGACTAEYADVSLIENGENLGFARGNNVGLKAASGEFVLLLNNDTFLAPGAIHAMVRHLQRNPGIGVVGPLTNNIGNEAMLPVNYGNMEEMKLIARECTTGYRGQFTPIRVAAYFAVMFRKQDLGLFGLLCEEYGLGMFEDDDHCEVIRSKGYLCAIAEDAFIHHHLSATFDTEMDAERKEALFDRNQAIFEEKWGPWQPHQYRQSRPASDLERSGE